MGVKQQIEERERLRAKDKHKVKLLCEDVETCLSHAKEQKLPTYLGLKALFSLIKYLLKKGGHL